jgi:hypothetical protein
MASAGTLIFELAADVSHLRADMAKAQAEMNSSLASIAKSSAASAIEMGAEFAKEFAASLAEHMSEALEQADALGKLAQRIGDTTENLSTLQYQAGKAGVNADDLTAAFRGLSKAMLDTNKPGSDAAAAFKAIGVSVDELKKQNPTEQMKTIAEAVSHFADGQDKIEAMRLIFGKMGEQLIPMLDDGAKGFDDAAKSAANLGAVVSGETAKSAAEFNDEMADLHTMANGLWMKLAEDLLPTLKELVTWFKENIVQTGALTDFLLMLGGAANTAAQAMVGLKGVSEAAVHAGKAWMAGASLTQGQDADTQAAIIKKTTDEVELMHRALDSAADAQKKMGDAWDKFKQSQKDHPAKQAGDDAGDAAKKHLDLAGALAATAKNAASAHQRLSDYQRMLQSLGDEARRLAAEGDPMKMLTTDPKFLAMTKDQQAALVQLTQANMDAKVAIDARKQAQDNAYNAEATQYKTAVAQWKAEEDHANQIWEWAQDQRKAIDPTIEYTETIEKLNEALHDGAINQDEYNTMVKNAADAAKAAQVALDPNAQKLKALRDTIEDFGETASDAFMSFATGADTLANSFRKMVADMLTQLAKMIVYQYVFKSMFSSTSGLASLIPTGIPVGAPASMMMPAPSAVPMLGAPGTTGGTAGGSLNAGGGAPSSNNVVVNVHVAKDDKATQDTTADSAKARELGTRIAAVVRQVISTEKRTGGLLAPSAG